MLNLYRKGLIIADLVKSPVSLLGEASSAF